MLSVHCVVVHAPSSAFKTLGRVPIAATCMQKAKVNNEMKRE